MFENDIQVSCLVQVIDHRCERRRFARTRRSGNKDHALVVLTKRFQDFRDV